MEIRGESARFAFLPPEDAQGALFDLGGGKEGDAEEALRELGAHDDLFESISDAHYLPELGGHDEALLESLVEKGCEDNQILGRLDRLSAQLVAPGAEFVDAALLGGAPVADIIGRLESLESPSRSAAQGLLHLRHLPQRRASALDPFADDVFTPEPPSVSQDARHSGPQGRLPGDGAAMFTEDVSDLPDAFDYEDYEDIARTVSAPTESTPVRTDATSSEETSHLETDRSTEVRKSGRDENEADNNDLIMLASEIGEMGYKLQIGDLEILKKVEPKDEEEEEIEKPTDLRKVLELDKDDSSPPMTELPPQTTIERMLDNEPSDKIDELPKDLSIHRRISSSFTSPRRIDIPRAPSRESDAMQSPQPSGIPAISSPEVFSTPTSKSKQPSFLESIYGSTSPKMFNSEVTIQQCMPLNLGKHRKSASPTVSSCSDDLRNVNKDAGEPQEKRVRREPNDLAKICNLLKKCGENKLAEAKQKKKQIELEQLSPLKQLELLKSNKNFNLPDPMLIPRDTLTKIIAAPGKEIPALLMERPQLNMSEILQDPNFIGDPELMVISLEQLRQLIIHSGKPTDKSKKSSESDHPKEVEKEPASTKPASKTTEQNKPSSTERTPTRSTPQPPAESSSAAAQPRPIPSMGHLADDIDAANSAAAYQMSWLPAYLNHINQVSQLEAVAACSQNAEFLKALSSSGGGGGYAGSNYANLSQMFHPSRFMNMQNFQMMPEYESRMQLAMWQEALNVSAAQAQRHKQSAADRAAADLLKEAPIPPEFPNPYAHFAKSQPQPVSKHAARTSPLAAPYSNAQRAQAHAHFMQNAYPGLNMRGAAPDIQIPYYTPHGSQRSPRASHANSPTAPYFPNNNYLQAKHDQARGSSGERGHKESRPRISVKSLQDLQHTALAHMSRRGAGHAAGAARRREEPEVGSTTSAGEPPAALMPHVPMPPHPHDAVAFPIWHPLFGNQKGYTSPWSWTTVTATGD